MMLSCKAGPGLGSLGDAKHFSSLWESPFFEKENIMLFLDIISWKIKEETKEIMISESFGSKEGNLGIKVDNELGKVTIWE